MSPIGASLWITLIGMSLVFVALLLLWLIMAWMARIPDAAPKRPTGEPVVSQTDVPTLADMPPLEGDPGMQSAGRRRAAALAVAVALAMRQARSGLQLTGREGEQVSNWQTSMRASRISQRNQIYTRK